MIVSNNKVKKIEQSIYEFIEQYYFVFCILIVAIASFNLFYNLGYVPVNDWDEARHGVNAYEMIKNNNLIVNTYGYINDYYNLKPPLSFWTIILGFKLFGMNVFGFRFFSSLTSLIAIIITMRFTYSNFGKISSLISGSVLATSAVYIIHHGARSGDADAIYVLFFTIAMIAMINCIEDKRWLYLAGFSFSLAFLAKSWHSLAIMAVGGVFLLLTGELFRLKIKQWVLFIASTIIPILLWAVVRIYKDGMEFIYQMINYDLLARTKTPLEGHTGPIYYYIRVLKVDYKYFLILGIIAFVVWIIYMDKLKFNSNKKKLLGITMWIIIPMVLFTLAKTKLSWYIYPIFPASSILIGITIEEVLKNRRSYVIVNFIVIVMMFFSLGFYERQIYKTLRTPAVDGIQISLKGLSKLDYKGSNIYIETDNWEQRYFFLAELYGDCIPKNGGINEFLGDNSQCLLLVNKNDKNKTVISDNNLIVVYEDKYSVILKR